MTSWITSLFGSTQTSQLIPSDGHHSDLNEYGGGRGTSYIAEKRKERNEALEEEEEARPHYLHVRTFLAQICAKKSIVVAERRI